MPQKQGDIITTGRFWANTTDGKIIDASQIDGFNLENGDVQDSLVQKYSGKVTDDGLYAPNTNKGIGSVVFGEANNNIAKRSLLAGKLNDSNAPNSIITGLYNGSSKLSEANGGPLAQLQGANLIVGGEMNQNIQSSDIGNGIPGDSSAVILSGKYNYNKDSRNTVLTGEDNTNDTSPHSIVSGSGNTNIKSENSLVLGRGNVNANSDTSAVFGTNNKNGVDNPDDETQNISADASILSGDGNTNKATYSALFGRFLSNSGEYSVVGGLNSKNIGPYSVVIGEANSNQATNGFLLGRYLVNYNGYCTVIGRSNKISSDAIFQIGNGWGTADPYDSRRSNAFEVTTGGVARAYGTPTISETSNDLIRGKELNTATTSLETAINNVKTLINNHKTNNNNPHGVTKSQVGLGNVDNTSDATKKTNFTGSIQSGNTGFVKGGDVYAELAKKASAATTLSGYGITNAYTKTDVDNKINLTIESNWNASQSQGQLTLSYYNSDSSLNKIVQLPIVFYFA